MPPRPVPRGSQRGGGPQRGGPARGARGGHGGAVRVGTQVGLPSTAGELRCCRCDNRMLEIPIDVPLSSNGGSEASRFWFIRYKC